MNDIERVDVLKHLILEIPLEKSNIIELKNKAEVHLERIRAALLELSAIKQRGKEAIKNLRAIDVSSTHHEVESRIKSIDYILKGEEK